MEEKSLDDVFAQIESRSEDDYEEPDDDLDEAVEETEEESAEEDNLSTDPDEDESRPDNPEEDPDEADDSEAVPDEGTDVPDEGTEPEGEEEDEPEESPDEEDEEEDGLEAVELPDDTVVGQDENGDPVTLRDLKDGNLRHSRFTQEMQKLAEQRKAMEKRQQDVASLTSELMQGEATRQFLSENPEALEMLLEDPEETREIINDPDAFDKFWKRWELVKDDPELQDALVSKRKNERADEILTEREEVEYVRTLGRDLATAIAAVGQSYEGVSDDEVATYVASLSGLDPNSFMQAAQSNPRALVDNMRTLERLFVRKDDRGEYIDPALIKDRFELLSRQRQQEVTDEQKSQEEHNKKVEEELEEADKRPPATPEGADAPGGKPKKSLAKQVIKEGGSLEDFMARSDNLG